MSESSGTPTRREMLVAAAATGVATIIPSAVYATAGDGDIRPFQVHFSNNDLSDLKRRIAATRWPEAETATDDSQGVRLATIQKLAKRWLTYDWRTAEAR